MDGPQGCKRRDLRRWTENPRTIAAAVALQLYGGVDPDHSRDLAERVVFAIDRAAARQHEGSQPTEDEVRRAYNALHRRGHPITSDEVRAVLSETFVFGWTGDV